MDNTKNNVGLDKYKDFPITSVCLADLESKGYDVSTISESDMSELASKMADAYLESGYWEALEVICDEVLKIKKNK